MHKYKLERQLQSPGSSAAGAAVLSAAGSPPSAGAGVQERWVTAHGELDDEDLLWQDIGLQVGADLGHQDQ